MDVEKTMQFVLDQQAQLVVSVQKLGEAHAVLAADMQRLQGAQARQQEMIGQVVSIVRDLAIAHRDLAESTDRRFRELADKVQDVTDNLNALIKIVDELIRRDGPRS